MRTKLCGGLACALFAVAAIAGVAQPPQQADDSASQLMAPYVPASLESDKEIAGLAPGSHPELLSWERAYALAVVRARSSRLALADTLDPSALTEAATRAGVVSFTRFRAEFLAEGFGVDRRFHDPGAEVLELSGRLQAIDNARLKVALFQRLATFIQERIRGESLGLNQFDVDFVHASIVSARVALAEQVRQFRDRLDQVKVALGLSPHAPVILDRTSIASFRAAFDALGTWNTTPNRRLDRLHELMGQLPALGDVSVSGQPILEVLEKNPDRWEDELTGAAQIAIKNRGSLARGQGAADASTQLELQVRRRIRQLFEIRRAYAQAKEGFELAIRLRDQAFEHLASPAAGNLPEHRTRSGSLKEVVDQVNEQLKAKDRLVELWTSFQAERLGLYRELGELPYNDWKSFYDDLSSRRLNSAADR